MILQLLFSTLLSTYANADFDVKNANVTLHLAWSAYCNETALSNWNCEWCGYTPKIQLVKYLRGGALSGTQGYVGYDPAGKRLIVAYRGSTTWQNDIEDALFWMTDFKAGPKGLKVDYGFQVAYNSLRSDTLAGLTEGRTLCPDCSILFTGHSLGAAMATLGAAEYTTLMGDVGRVHLFTYGCPRVGNSEFAQWAWKSLNQTSTRMARERDIVPSIPPQFLGYRHLPREVWNRHANGKADWFVVCDDTGEDSNCYDSEINLMASQHTWYMGFGGGGCGGGR